MSVDLDRICAFCRRSVLKYAKAAEASAVLAQCASPRLIHGRRHIILTVPPFPLMELIHGTMQAQAGGGLGQFGLWHRKCCSGVLHPRKELNEDTNSAYPFGAC